MGATRIINAAGYVILPWPPMSTTPSQTPTTVSLADEEAVRFILVTRSSDFGRRSIT